LTWKENTMTMLAYCPVCKSKGYLSPLRRGKAIVNKDAAHPARGALLQNVLKCPACGYSRTGK
jgi:hypothetical protein